jgi:hypothetical protein
VQICRIVINERFSEAFGGVHYRKMFAAAEHHIEDARRCRRVCRIALRGAGTWHRRQGQFCAGGRPLDKTQPFSRSGQGRFGEQLIKATDCVRNIDPRYDCRAPGQRLTGRSPIGVGDSFCTPDGAFNPVASFNQFVGAQQNRWGYRKTERLGGLTIHDHLEFCRQLNG